MNPDLALVLSIAALVISAVSAWYSYRGQQTSEDQDVNGFVQALTDVLDKAHAFPAALPEFLAVLDRLQFFADIDGAALRRVHHDTELAVALSRLREHLQSNELKPYRTTSGAS